MKNLSEQRQEKLGVLGHRIENNHYIVGIKWRDGKKVEEHFPVNGFAVVNEAGKLLGHLSGKKALDILEKNASKLTQDEFSWRDFL